MFSGMGDSITALIIMLIVVPFGIWEIIELIMWVFHHIKVV